MLNSKHILTLAALSTLVACAIPEPGKKDITLKVAGPQLELSQSQQPSKMISEEYDSEISIAIANKIQFSVCLQSNSPEKTIKAGDLIILFGAAEDRHLAADANGCITWQDSIETAQGTQLKEVEIRRKIEMKSKFPNTLEVLISFNAATGETAVTLAGEEKAQLALDQKMLSTEAKNPEGYDLGFETLTLKVEKKADGTRSLSLEGSPTLNGEPLRYARLKGQLILTVSTDGKTQTALKTLNAKGGVREGALALKIEDNQFKCDQGQIMLDLQLNTLSKRHNVKPFREVHVLKSCTELEGTMELNNPLK